MQGLETLPTDVRSVLELAARSMFDLFGSASEGMMLVDRNARVVWINDQYKRFLPALGFERVEDFVGHPVSGVVPNTLMHRVLETGKPILIDLLTNRAGTFVVSPSPLVARRRPTPGSPQARLQRPTCCTTRSICARPKLRAWLFGLPMRPWTLSATTVATSARH